MSTRSPTPNPQNVDVATLIEIANIAAADIGLRLGQRVLRREIMRRGAEEMRQIRERKRELDELLAKLENGEISPQEYKKRKGKLLAEIKGLKEKRMTKVRPLYDQLSKVVRVERVLAFNILANELRAAGFAVAEIIDPAELPEWIRRLVEAEEKRPAQKHTEAKKAQEAQKPAEEKKPQEAKKAQQGKKPGK